MKYQLTKDQLESLITNIVTEHMDVPEAMEYALSVCGEFTYADAELVWPEDSNRMDIVAQNGNDGLHYEAIK